MDPSRTGGGVVAQDEWISYQAGPTWLGRLVSPGNSRPGTMSYLAVGAAAVAYACSLAFDWIGATGVYAFPQSEGDVRNFANFYGAQITADGSHATVVATSNVTSLELMGLVYGLGGLALVVVGFAVLSRPDLALRGRMAAAG